ncbi:MAG: heme exporter protein CcmD [Zoogloeaceae bacterium]|nr:heme exporter protein CcmD [Zoogloeaceae bacterium]
MNWNSWAAFWDMGGAAFYVWGSYGVTFIAIVAELLLVFRRRRDTLTRLLRLRRAQGGRPAAASPDSSD